MHKFRELIVWQRAMELARNIYSLTRSFPYTEQKGIISQLQRAAVSIAANIAEGAGRKTPKDFAHFLEISLGSSFEVETQLLISKNLHYISVEKYTEIMNELAILQKQLNNFIQTIRLKANS